MFTALTHHCTVTASRNSWWRWRWRWWWWWWLYIDHRTITDRTHTGAGQCSLYEKIRFQPPPKYVQWQPTVAQSRWQISSTL